MNQEKKHNRPQVKICGLTTPEMAAACVKHGADAVGCVFYPPSPRHVSTSLAANICAAVAGTARTVGVFVNTPPGEIIQTMEDCGLEFAQLHGTESPEMVTDLRRRGIMVIKTLFAEKPPLFSEASRYYATVCLVECGRGKLPGGNARTWNWTEAAPLALRQPLILAGGLTPDNVTEAIQAARPDAVDVSSGVEKSPGIKDMEKVRAFIRSVNAAVETTADSKPFRRIF